jgi:hypothetical protein
MAGRPGAPIAAAGRQAQQQHAGERPGAMLMAISPLKGARSQPTAKRYVSDPHRQCGGV